MEFEAKTLAVREIINLALKKKLEKDQYDNIQSFLNDIPEKSNYNIISSISILSYFFDYFSDARVGILLNDYEKSTQTFRKHISLYELHNYCYLILNKNQYNSLSKIYSLVRDEMLLSYNKSKSIVAKQYGEPPETNRIPKLFRDLEKINDDAVDYRQKYYIIHHESKYDENNRKVHRTYKEIDGLLKLIFEFYPDEEENVKLRDLEKKINDDEHHLRQEKYIIYHEYTYDENNRKVYRKYIEMDGVRTLSWVFYPDTEENVKLGTTVEWL